MTGSHFTQRLESVCDALEKEPHLHEHILSVEDPIFLDRFLLLRTLSANGILKRMQKQPFRKHKCVNSACMRNNVLTQP